jgi:hypothetical protein
MALTISKAELIGVFVESLAYGFVIPSLCQCVPCWSLPRCISDGVQSVHVCTKEEIFATKWLPGWDCGFTVHPHHSSTYLLYSILSTHLMDSLAPCHRHPAQCSGFHRKWSSAKLSNHILWHIWHLAKHSKEYSVCRCYIGVRRIHCTHPKLAIIQIQIWAHLQLYRSFILWGRNYFIAALPFLLFIADIGLFPSAVPLLRLTHKIAIGVFWVYTLSLVVPGENVFADALSIRVKTFYSITLAMNVICTCLLFTLHSSPDWIRISVLIAVKILKIQKVVAPFAKGSEDQISRLVPIIVESGKNSGTTFSDMCSCTNRRCVLGFTRDYDWYIYF